MDIPVEEFAIYEQIKRMGIEAYCKFVGATFDGDREGLYDSIKTEGIKTPLKVVLFGNKYRIYGGNHRYIIAIMLGLKTVLCEVKPYCSYTTFY